MLLDALTHLHTWSAMSLHNLTATQAVAAIADGSITPLELMEHLTTRSDVLEPDLELWVTMDRDGAIDASRKSGARLGEPKAIGRLHGLPVGVKDIFYTDGLKTTAGSPIYRDFVPTFDCTAVALLKAAGAIVMGKTVTTEFACTDPSPTRNPWNAAHTPGGSSSGSAVGVAARIFPAALGSQTAGSVLRPASYNGVVGFKPTFGRVSRYGVFPVAWSLDTIGWFTRSVADAALLLSVLAGHDPNDYSTSTRPVPDYTKALTSSSTPPSIGLVRQLYKSRAEPAMVDHTEDVARRFKEAGADVREVAVAMDFDTLLAAHRVIMSVEAATVHEVDFRSRPDDYGPKVRALIEAGTVTPAVTYVQAQRLRRRFRRDVEEAARDLDVLMTPTTPTPAPRDLTTTGNHVFQSPWTTAGVPAITLPSGLSEAGLPMGVQLASAPFAEETLLSGATWCEEVLDVALRPPIAR